MRAYAAKSEGRTIGSSGKFSDGSLLDLAGVQACQLLSSEIAPPYVQNVVGSRPSPRRPGLDPGLGFHSAQFVKKKPNPGSSPGRRQVLCQDDQSCSVRNLIATRHSPPPHSALHSQESPFLLRPSHLPKAHDDAAPPFYSPSGRHARHGRACWIPPIPLLLSEDFAIFFQHAAGLERSATNVKRHCERSAAIQRHQSLDCRAPLAMTGEAGKALGGVLGLLLPRARRIKLKHHMRRIARPRQARPALQRPRRSFRPPDTRQPKHRADGL
jgi:hypothetical protein